MTRAFIPTMFQDEEITLRPFSSLLEEFKSCSSKNGSYGVGIHEEEDAILVEAPLPGLKPDEIKVSLKEGILYIHGEKKEEKKEGKTHCRCNSKYAYSILLPQPVDETGEVSAETKDGILSLRLLKSKASRPLKIVVKGS